MTIRRADALLGGTAAVSIAAVVAAYATQQVWNMQPCPWCILQRMIFLAVAAAALIGLVWRSPLGRRVGAGLAFGLAGCGLAAALWQHFVAASAASCDLTLADRIVAWTGLDGRFPDWFMPMASCADAAVKLAGMPYEFWSGSLFAATGLAMAAVIARPRG